MIISTRAKKMIEYLRAHDRYVKVADIAHKLDITQRTVYRVIGEITKIAKDYNLILESKEGKGVKICGDIEDLKVFDLALHEMEDDEIMNGNHRVNLLILWLLQQDDLIKTQSLALDLNVSLQTVRNDLKEAIDILQAHHIVLVSKKGSGIKVEGNEMAIRHLMVNILLEFTEVETLYKWIRMKEDTRDSFLKVMDAFGYKEVVHKVFSILIDILNEQDNDVSKVEFVLLISALLVRHHKVDETSYYHYSNQNRMKIVNSSLGVELEDIIVSSFDIQLSDLEKEYLRWLASLHLQKHVRANLHNSDELCLIDKVRELVISVESNLGVKVHHDATLMSGLLSHLDRAFVRVHNKMFLSNPMKDEIKRDYKIIYQTIKISFESVFPQEQFPDDEIAYLVLYFVVAVDKLMSKSARALVICTSGMGSSKLLANRLEKEIPEIHVKKISSLLGLQNENMDNYDLIISTVPLDIKNEKCMIVSPLLSEEEVESIKRKIGMQRNQIIHRNAKLRHQKEQTNEEMMEDLYAIQKISSWGIDLIENFTVIPIHIHHEEDVMDPIGAYLLQQDFISLDNFRKALRTMNEQQLFEIPDTKLIYFEYCSMKLNYPTFLVFTFEKEEQLVQIHGIQSYADTFIMILYPNEDVMMLEFLSALAIAIIDNAYTIQIFEEGSAEDIKALLCNKIKQYIAERF